METMVHIMECGLADAVPGGIIILDEDKYVASPRISCLFVFDLFFLLFSSSLSWSLIIHLLRPLIETNIK
ncbi:hypothetical protein I7I53_05649 [Histoplasma capsulatum var. duboisii H88]|uniref:Uncharacterized protein n=1 Tax=Ajellomyces capsulatus (strain H88) TaxID=544711 RepID=A0A8A1LTW5_AJEC8|nr:hypothetical protein I7I53_05649 [Histoplasma capsulatum var. duboisii H88]